MFKIVQTLEKGKKELTIVPELWETNNTLFWPKKWAYRLQKEVDSAPEPDWFTMSCTVKRRNLGSYKIAEKIMDEMLEKEDTETENEEDFRRPQKRARVLLPRNSNNNIFTSDFNSLADTCTANVVEISSTPSTSTANNDIVSFSDFQTYNVLFNEPSLEQQVVGEYNVEALTEQEQESLEPPVTTQDNGKLDLLLEKIDSVILNQNKLIREFAKFQTVFEIAMKKKEVENVPSKIKKPLSPIEVIDSLEELKIFNEQLNNEDTYNGYIERLSFICGKNSKGKAIDHCYMLVDKLFTRNFFTLCSWAGGAKLPKTKFAFKFYENVISLFFKLINLADNNFTLQDCEEFFKNVIRNSLRRNQCTHFRASKSKNRPKKLNYARKESENQNPLENGDNKDEVNPSIDESSGDGTKNGEPHE